LQLIISFNKGSCLLYN